MKDREVRFVKGAEIRAEKRAEGEGDLIVGHAAVFNSPTDIGGWFEEEIMPGAFAAAERGDDDVRGLFNHNPDLILGRNSAGTLRLEQDKQGLAYEIDPPDTGAGRDVLVSIERKDITGSSFGFRAIRQEWIEREGKLDLRRIHEVELFDVSPVTFPAFKDTDVSKRYDVAKRQHEEFRSGLEGGQNPEDVKPEGTPARDRMGMRLKLDA